MVKVNYREGDWFALPLREGGFAVGVIARANPEAALLGYFFGPRRGEVPSLGELSDLRAGDAVLGRLVTTGDSWEPFRLVDVDGSAVGSVSAWFSELQAAGRSATTLRSYGMDLLRWFRFLWAVGVAWDRAGRGAGLLPLVAGRWQAFAAALASPRRTRSRFGSGVGRRRVFGVGSCS